MRYKLLMLTFFLIVVLFAVCACADNNSDKAENNEDNEIISAELIGNPIIREEMLVDGENQYADITINSLELVGESNQQAIDKINQYLFRLGDSYLDEITAADSISYDADSTVKFTHSREFMILYQDSDIISIGVECYDYTEGAAHPYIGRLAYSFDLASGEVKTAADYFGEDAAEKIAADIYAQIEQEGNIAEFNPDLQNDLLNNFGEGKWYEKEDHLVIIYNPYEIAAYSSGILEFTVLYSL